MMVNSLVLVVWKDGNQQYVQKAGFVEFSLDEVQEIVGLEGDRVERFSDRDYGVVEIYREKDRQDPSKATVPVIMEE